MKVKKVKKGSGYYLVFGKIGYMNKECPSCLRDDGWIEGQLFDRCQFCDYEVDKRMPLEASLELPGIGGREYQMKTVDEIYGYIVYFKEGEPKMPYKEPHVHIRGQGREIQYFLSPLRVKKKIPKNFPEREESKIYGAVKKKWPEYLAKWNEAKNN